MACKTLCETVILLHVECWICVCVCCVYGDRYANDDRNWNLIINFWLCVHDCFFSHFLWFLFGCCVYWYCCCTDVFCCCCCFCSSLQSIDNRGIKFCNCFQTGFLLNRKSKLKKHQSCVYSFQVFFSFRWNSLHFFYWLLIFFHCLSWYLKIVVFYVCNILSSICLLK